MRAAHALAPILAGTLALAAAPVAAATVRSSFAATANGQGMLRVESDAAADSIVVGCVGSGVLVNGAPPDSGLVECFRVNRIEVAGGPGGDRIDLGGFEPAQTFGVFRGVSASALVDGGEGDDVIDGPAGGLVRIVGGPGSDWMAGHSIDAYVFAPAERVERDTIVEPASDDCEPSYFDSYQHGLSYWTVPWDSLDFRSLAADDPVTVDGRAPGGILAAHRNRTISRTGGEGGVALEAIAGTPGGDRIASACMAVGEGGDDMLAGTSTAGDLLLGGEGNDRLEGRGGPDRLDGGPGTDELDGGDDPDALVGGRGNDRLRGGGGGDTYLFQPADRQQSDRVAEGATQGVDVLSFDLGAETPVRVDLSTGSAVVARAAGLELRVAPGTARFLEGVIGGKGDDRLVGNAGRNHFWSGGGSDLAVGGRGDDVYHVDWAGSMPYAAYAWGEVWSGPFERGAEDGRSVWTVRETKHSRLRIDEGARGGFDTIDLAERFLSSETVGTRLEGQLSGWRVDLSAPLWLLRHPRLSARSVRPGGTRHLEGIVGTSGPDVLIGNGANNVLEGRWGADRVNAGAGRDTCLVWRKDDTLRGCERVRTASPDR